MFENETLWHSIPCCAMVTALKFDCVDALEDGCDLCIKNICFGC